MGFVKFVFVLVIIIPLAVLMIYLINNLNKNQKSSFKNQQDEREKAVRESSSARQDVRPERSRYDSGRFSQKTYSSANDRDADRYKRETPYYKRKQERAEETVIEEERPVKTLSKRKRRKERKNKRKVRDK